MKNALTGLHLISLSLLCNIFQESNILCLCLSKHMFTASTALGLVKIRPPNLSGWKSWGLQNNMSTHTKTPIIIVKHWTTRAEKLTRSESSFIHTNVKDSTGIKSAVWPHKASSWKININIYHQCFSQLSLWMFTVNNEELQNSTWVQEYLDIRVCSMFSGLFEKQHFHSSAHVTLP